MKYVTGIYALNLPCELETCGDWHSTSLDWGNVKFAESEYSFFLNYGIEERKQIPNNEGLFAVANHIRAILDLLAENNFGLAQGMRRDFIVTDIYDTEIFNKVFELRTQKSWDQINMFMMKEYGRKWIKWMQNKEQLMKR